MCLGIVDKKIDRKICTGKGWKVFKKFKGKLYGDSFGTDIERPRGKWLNERSFSIYENLKISADLPGFYPRGWHIFTSRYAADQWKVPGWYAADQWKTPGYHSTVLPVEYKTILATGSQGGKKVVIARWIKIAKKVIRNEKT